MIFQNLLEQPGKGLEIETELNRVLLSGSDDLRGWVEFDPAVLAEVNLHPGMSLIGPDLVEVQDLRIRIDVEAHRHPGRNAEAAAKQGHGKGKVGAVTLLAHVEEVGKLIAVGGHSRHQGVVVVVLQIVVHQKHLVETTGIPGRLCNLFGQLPDAFIPAVLCVEFQLPVVQGMIGSRLPTAGRRANRGQILQPGIADPGDHAVDAQERGGVPVGQRGHPDRIVHADQGGRIEVDEEVFLHHLMPLQVARIGELLR